MIQVSSPAGRTAAPWQAAYAASQATLELLSEAPRFVARRFGVRAVVALAPDG